MQVKDIVKTLPKHPTTQYKSRPLRILSAVVVHHSATTSGTPEAFARYHVGQGWPGIGYHYVIGRDGLVYKCQPASVISYHASGANAHSLGVCLVGNLDEQQPTPEQMAALMELLQDLIKWYGIKPGHVIGHREVPGTHKSCPGRHIDMQEIRRKLGA